MIYPKKDVIYENMNTSFTNFGELLSNLSANNFTGSVKISFWEYEGNLFIDNGKVVNAVEEFEGERVTGKDAVKHLKERAKEKDGSISVYALTEEMVTVLGTVVQSELLYKDLTTEFTSMEGLINKLRNEDQTGYMEVSIGGGSRKAYIYFLSGEIISCLLKTGGEEISGVNLLHRIMDASSSQGAKFNVYKAAIEESFAEGEEIRVSDQFPQILEVWGEIIGAIESVMDDHLTKGHFLNTFKEVMIEHADEYPFIDPFAAKFHYQEGEVTFRGEPEKQLSEGVGVCLKDTIKRLDSEHPEIGLETLVKQHLAEVKEERLTAIKDLGIDDHLFG